MFAKRSFFSARPNFSVMIKNLFRSGIMKSNTFVFIKLVMLVNFITLNVVLIKETIFTLNVAILKENFHQVECRCPVMKLSSFKMSPS